jgi:hypothetical protein
VQNFVARPSSSQAQKWKPQKLKFSGRLLLATASIDEHYGATIKPRIAIVTPVRRAQREFEQDLLERVS